jgi:hypothetical protein
VLVLLFSLAALSGSATAASAHPLVGIADNKTTFFTDPRFLALGTTQVRYDVPWDAIVGHYPGNYELDQLTQWLDAAHASGQTPLITFDHSALAGKSTELPTPAQYSAAFLAFRAAFPSVTQFSTWNETNYYGQAIARHPKLDAEYYLKLRADCSNCTVLAAELLDDTDRSIAVPMTKYAREVISYAGMQPAYWGLHNYVGANRLQTTSTKQLLAAVRGNIWFTETAGLVARHNHSVVHFPQSAAHAAIVDNFILNTLANLSPRIQRVYLYEWNAVTPNDGWDSALISWNGVPRQGYYVLANTLDAWGIAPNCSISVVPPACAGIGGGGSG